MKSERISILGTPEFKEFLTSEARKAGISVSELVRRRCGWPPSEDDALLATMADELRRAVEDARHAVDGGLRAVREVLAEAGRE